MATSSRLAKTSWLYLLAVPILVSIFGFGLGKISYQWYVPIWLINVGLMLAACRAIGPKTKGHRTTGNLLGLGGFFLIAPLILISMFFGLGPPPETPAAWVATATEQQVRYTMLAITGIFIALGFAFLREKCKQEKEQVYSLISIICILIAIPLFVLNMLYWGFSLTESFRLLLQSSLEKFPPWFSPIRVLFGMISATEVGLTYLATLFLVLALRKTGRLGTAGTVIYVVLNILAFLLNVLGIFLPEPFITIGFIVSIPAIPFMMPYFLGVHLLRMSGKEMLVHEMP